MSTEPPRQRSRRVMLPAQAKAGELVEVRSLIQHDMVTGQTRDSGGQRIPRNIINRLVVSYDGREVFSVEPGPGISANPYFSFWLRATRTGEVVFTWSDDDGGVHVERRVLNVLPAS